MNLQWSTTLVYRAYRLSMAGKELWLALGLGLPLLLFAWVYHHSRRLLLIGKGGAKLPPGNFWQLPFVGESIQFLKGSADDYMLPQLSKYGRTFRTHLLGAPSICITTADAAKFVLRSATLFKQSQSASTTALFGKDAVNLTEGQAHLRFRKIIQTPINSGSLKDFIAHMDEQARKFWNGTADQAVINCHKDFLNFSISVALLFVCEDLELDLETKQLVQLFQTFEDGLIGLPIDVPGTIYNKALKARSKIQTFLHQRIQKRRQEKGLVLHNDLLDAFLNSEDSLGSNLTDHQVAETIMFVLVAAHESSANNMVWSVRNLCLYPKILELVKAENDAVARKRGHVDDPITWEDLQELTLTTKFIQESMRIANVIAFVWREATQDVVYNGMLFPMGWKVFVWFRYFHLDPELYTNPLEFNPWRFETQPKISTFTPFGNGYRVCPGRELAMNEMLVFMHRFLISFDFEAIGDLDKIQHWTMPHPKDGLPLRLTRRSIDPLAT